MTLLYLPEPSRGNFISKPIELVITKKEEDYCSHLFQVFLTVLINNKINIDQNLVEYRFTIAAGLEQF